MFTYLHSDFRSHFSSFKCCRGIFGVRKRGGRWESGEGGGGGREGRGDRKVIKFFPVSVHEFSGGKGAGEEREKKVSNC